MQNTKTAIMQIAALWMRRFSRNRNEKLIHSIMHQEASRKKVEDYTIVLEF